MLAFYLFKFRPCIVHLSLGWLFAHFGCGRTLGVYLRGQSLSKGPEALWRKPTQTSVSIRPGTSAESRS